jgi:cytochrome b6-f complex iron-sulfur subunit
MATTVVIVLALLLAVIGFLLLAMSGVRRRAERLASPVGIRVVRSRVTTEPGPPPPAVAPAVLDTPEVQMNRRLFLNRAWLLAMSVFGVAFAGTSVGMLWPNKISGFGGKINAGKLTDILNGIRQADGVPYYNPVGRFYIVPYAHADDPNNMYVKAGVAKDGIMVIFQKCAHLGCRVPYCPTSHWFECPCHGSKYNYAGERQPGSPAPAGLWRFPFDISGGVITVDTSDRRAQPPAGTDTIHQPPAGPHCVSIGAK